MSCIRSLAWLIAWCDFYHNKRRTLLAAVAVDKVDTEPHHNVGLSNKLVLAGPTEVALGVHTERTKHSRGQTQVKLIRIGYSIHQASSSLHSLPWSVHIQQAQWIVDCMTCAHIHTGTYTHTPHSSMNSSMHTISHFHVHDKCARTHTHTPTEYRHMRHPAVQ